MKKVLALLLAVIMLISVVPISALAVGEEAVYHDKILDGLADPAYTKTTANYDGYHFVKGTKCVWDCKLYTLTATATKVNGAIVTFTINFTSKIPDTYLNNSSYDITAISNYPDGFDSESGKPGKSFQISVDTCDRDPLSTSSAAGGIQFLKIRVRRIFHESWFPIDSGNAYYADIVKNRDVYPENAGYFTEVDLEDVYGLSYYIKPSFTLNTNSIKVSQTAIALGIYGFDGQVNYRVKGTSSWKKKAVAKNTAVKITGLKANTIYQIQLLCKLPYTDLETGQDMYLLDIVGKTFNLCTAINTKPLLKKVTISKCKYGKKTVKGYWESDGDWHPKETFYTCSYSMTITLRNVPKNVKGLYWKQGGAAYYAKGRKGTYTFKLYYQAKKPVKGIKLPVYLYYSSNTINNKAVGFSPARGITYRLKNSTTNYKK